MSTGPADPTTPSGVSRRSILAWAGAGAAVAGASGLAFTAGRTLAVEPAGPTPDVVPFFGEHQAGIVTPAQEQLLFASFDVDTKNRDELIALLRAWTKAAAAMTQGHPVGAANAYDSPPDDTGDALDLPASNLTITFGFGPSLFDGRFGLADRKPALLEKLPHFPADKLDPQLSDGDLCIQACADDAQVAFHALRNLRRIAFGTAHLRWSQLGYGRTSSTSSSQKTPRNLFGFKDGTANIKAEHPQDLADHVWVAADDPKAGWLTGGTYLVARRIAMNIETWDRTSLREQENIFARDRRHGAPLSGGDEFAQPNFEMKGRGDKPLIDPRSHVTLAHPSTNNGAKMLRRGYNYSEGNDSLGRMQAGLFFLAYVRNPATQYIPMQMKMSASDLLMEYIQHRGSSLWAIPPGVREGGYVGQGLFT